jgi:hypothetical protein
MYPYLICLVCLETRIISLKDLNVLRSYIFWDVLSCILVDD